MAELGKRQQDGASLHDHLMAAWSATGRQPEELEQDELPPCIGVLLETYLDLSKTRGSNGMGYSPLNYADLSAWQHVTGVQLTPWEAETLLAMDTATIQAQSEHK